VRNIECQQKETPHGNLDIPRSIPWDWGNTSLYLGELVMGTYAVAISRENGIVTPLDVGKRYTLQSAIRKAEHLKETCMAECYALGGHTYIPINMKPLVPPRSRLRDRPQV